MRVAVSSFLDKRNGFRSFAAWSLFLIAAVATAPKSGPPARAPGSKQRMSVRVRHAEPGSAKSKHQAATPAQHAAPSIPVRRAPSPLSGKGMWIYQMERVAHGNPARIAHLARQGHLTHIYVRVGSSVAGLRTLVQAASLIPHAHRHGIKVIAWYFPYFNNIPADVGRSLATIRHRVRGHGFDGFAADIESAAGSAMSAKTVWEYSWRLRATAPEAYLIAVPPRPTSSTIKRFPYAAMMPHYDAVAPMVYWGRFDPIQAVSASVHFFARWGKPVSPIGQAYDMSQDHSSARRGVPPPHEIWAFMRTAMSAGAPSVSFWSWQHADAGAWRSIRLFPWKGRAIAPPAPRPRPSSPLPGPLPEPGRTRGARHVE